MQDRSFPFTRNRVRDLPIPATGRVTYKDSSTKGLKVRVSQSGSKIFSYVGKLDGKSKRVSIGLFGEVTVSQAQSEAARLKRTLKTGINPTKSKQSEKDASVTLSQCLADYLRVHDKLAPATVQKYTSEPQRLLKSWLNKPLKDISRTDIATKHKAISKKSPATANRVMRLMRALFNFANQEYEDEKGKGLFPDNPVSRLSHQRLWNKIERRTGCLKPHQLKEWFEATEALPDCTRFGEVQRDYLQLVLFTGLRRSEALGLKWENIDFKGRTLLVPVTKNGKPHMLPMPDYVQSLLARRYEARTSEFVFPACYGKGHLIEPQKAINKVKELTGIHFTLHDLRRTFITIAESLDISSYAVKRLVNHSMGDDVTAGYICWDVERIRNPIQRISDYITKAVGIKESADIITLPMMKAL